LSAEGPYFESMTSKSQAKSVDEVIFSLPKNEQIIMKRLRSLILECLPKATEKISYGVPFYSHNRMICFIWPPSIYWGPKKQWNDKAEKGVTLGFCQGNLMSNADGALLAEGRKQVYCMYFQSLNEIHDEQIRSFLFEAEIIDNGFKKRRTQSRLSR
jgi:hypothetical protein